MSFLFMPLQLSGETRNLNFGLCLHLYPYYESSSGEVSGETAQVHNLVRAFAARICDTYQNLMSELIQRV